METAVVSGMCHTANNSMAVLLDVGQTPKIIGKPKTCHGADIAVEVGTFITMTL